MIGGAYRISDYGDHELNIYPVCDEFNPELFRKYFYGYWEGEHTDDDGNCQYLIIDDSEYAVETRMSSATAEFYTGRIGWHGEDVIITDYIITGGTYVIKWIDINNPDVMYRSAMGGSNFAHIFVYHKTDTPLNEPRNGYLSMLQAREIALQYDIDYNMLTSVNETLDDGRKVFYSFPGGYFPASIYLIFESPDKLILKTSELWIDDEFNDVEKITFIIEKINGEWIRKIEAT